MPPNRLPPERTGDAPVPTDRRRVTSAAPRGANGLAERPRANVPDPGVRVADTDPYAAPGLRIGTVRVAPQFGLFGGVRLLPTAGPQEDARRNVLDIAPQVDVTTDWSRHGAEMSVRGRVRLAEDVPIDRNYDFDARLRGRLDLSGDTTVTLEAGARGQGGETLATALPGGVGPQGGLATLDTDVAEGIVGSVASPAALRERDEENTVAGSVAIAHRLGRLALTGAGEVERTRRTGEDTATTYRLRGRAALDGGIAAPFVEATAARTRFCDPCGDDFDALGGLVGIAFAETARLSGEVALGYEHRSNLLDDGTETGLVWRGALSYEATPLITLDIGTEATLGDEEDGASRAVTLGLTYLPRRWLTLTGGLAVTWEEFETLTGPATPGARPGTVTGTTRAVTASLGAEYRLNRNAAIAADATQQRYVDGVTGDESIENTFRLGVVLRR